MRDISGEIWCFMIPSCLHIYLLREIHNWIDVCITNLILASNFFVIIGVILITNTTLIDILCMRAIFLFFGVSVIYYILSRL